MEDQKQDESKKFLNIEGAPGESIFRRPISFLLTPSEGKFYEAVFQKELEEYWAHYKELEDERAVVVVGSLCVEDCLDKMIEAIFPRSKELLENKDFSLSLKIDLIQAYKIIPNRILNDCDTIRQMRNDFAHELNIKTFDDWEISVSEKNENRKDGERKRKNFKNGIDQSLRIYDSDYDLSLSCRKRFEYFVGVVTIALVIYTTHVQAMRKFIDSQDFGKALVEFSKRNYHETQG